MENYKSIEISNRKKNNKNCNIFMDGEKNLTELPRTYQEHIKTYQPNGNARLGFSIWKELFIELAASRELILRLFIRDISARYRQSILGIIWTFIMPLFTVGTFVYLNYSGVFELGKTSIPYPAYALLGLTIWQLFATGITACTTSLSGAGNLITKINFAKESLVIASLAQTIFDFFIRVFLVAGVFAIYRIVPSWTIIFLPFALLPLLLLTLGLGFILSIANGILRDTTNIVAVATTLLMFITPVLYPAQTFEPIATFNRINPVGILVITARDLVIEGSLKQPNEFIYAAFFSLIIFFGGWRAFHISEPRMAERV
ncbi:MAG TPA: ABC transporter permease [Candidatus Methanoperedens sp.]